MSAIENPKISKDDLNKLEERVKTNNASPDEYARLDNYLSFLGLDYYILNKLKDNRINSYEDFIYERGRELKSNNINNLVGLVFGVISFLQKHISGKL